MPNRMYSEIIKSEHDANKRRPCKAQLLVNNGNKKRDEDPARVPTVDDDKITSYRATNYPNKNRLHGISIFFY